VSFLHGRGEDLPGDRSFDLIVSIGVLQFIPNPRPVIAAAFTALKPGGRFFVWLYAKEGTAIYRRVLAALRLVGTVLPHAALAAMVRVIDVPLVLYMALCRVLPLPLHDYVRNVLSHFTPQKRRLVIYDQLNPTHSRYYSRAEAEQLVDVADLKYLSDVLTRDEAVAMLQVERYTFFTLGNGLRIRSAPGRDGV